MVYSVNYILIVAFYKLYDQIIYINFKCSYILWIDPLNLLILKISLISNFVQYYLLN